MYSEASLMEPWKEEYQLVDDAGILEKSSAPAKVYMEQLKPVRKSLQAVRHTDSQSKATLQPSVHTSYTHSPVHVQGYRQNTKEAGASLLPETASMLAMILQNDATLVDILAQFGGQTVRIPARWPPRGVSQRSKRHILRQVLSPKQMEKVVAHYGGTELYIPRCTQHWHHIRNTSIVRAFSKATQRGASSGQTVQNLAQRYHLSDRRIWSILKNTVLTCEEDATKPPQNKGNIVDIDSDNHIQ